MPRREPDSEELWMRDRRKAVLAERRACIRAVEATIKDHDEHTPGGWCAANAARHAANAIRKRNKTD